MKLLLLILAFFHLASLDGYASVVGGPDDTTASCDPILTKENSDSGTIPQLSLPHRDSAHYRALLRTVIAQIESQNFAIVDLSEIITQQFGKAWFDTFPKKASSVSDGTVLSFSTDGGLVQETPNPAVQSNIESLHSWFRDLVSDAVGKTIEVKQGFYGVRTSQPNDKNNIFPNWHVDGGDASVLMALHGPGLEYLDVDRVNRSKSWDYHNIVGLEWEKICKDCKPTVLPRAHAIIFFGSKAGTEGKMAPLIHRTPSFEEERSIFLARYY